jgi:hypothetical protein
MRNLVVSIWYNGPHAIRDGGHPGFGDSVNVFSKRLQ